MFNWFRRKKTFTADEVAQALFQAETSVSNSGKPLTWKQIFGNAHPRSFSNDDSSQLTLSAIFCAVNTYIGAITSLPRFVQRIDPRNGKTQSFLSPTDHPAARIWNHYANDEWSSTDMLRQMIYDILFADGNFYAIPERDSMNRVYRIRYIHPDRIPRGNIYRSKGGEQLSNGRKTHEGQLVYKVIADPERPQSDSFISQQHFLLQQDEIIHMKGLTPDPRYYRSRGIIECNLENAELYHSSEKMGKDFYSSGYLNQTFLSTDKKLSPAVRKELEDLVNNNPSSTVELSQLFRTRILEYGLKPVNVGVPFDQLQFIETRAFSIEDVARWFNMPAYLLHSQMGTSSNVSNPDQLMIIWIQNGLGHLMTNIAEEFRRQIVPRPTQPLLRFDFNRLHLYKTVLNDFTQALRNLFEIGAVNRAEIADLVGVHIDLSDKYNEQRYVPANLITPEHSKLLEEKTQASVTLLETKTEAEQKRLDDPQPQPPQVPSEAPEAPVTPSEGQPDQRPSDDPANPGKAQDEPNQDNQMNLISLNCVRTALMNTVRGFHEYELRVIRQKLETRKDDFQDSVQEWLPKFRSSMSNSFQHWEPIFRDRFGFGAEDFVSSWVEDTQTASASEDPVSQLESNFLSRMEFIYNEMEKINDRSE